MGLTTVQRYCAACDVVIWNNILKLVREAGASSNLNSGVNDRWRRVAESNEGILDVGRKIFPHQTMGCSLESVMSLLLTKKCIIIFLLKL